MLGEHEKCLSDLQALRVFSQHPKWVPVQNFHRDLGEILGRILATEIQKSRRPKSCRDSEISAAKILKWFRNLGGQNPAVITKSRPPKSCRELAEIQKSLGGQNPASRKDAIVF